MLYSSPHFPEPRQFHSIIVSRTLYIRLPHGLPLSLLHSNYSFKTFFTDLPTARHTRPTNFSLVVLINFNVTSYIFCFVQLINLQTPVYFPSLIFGSQTFLNIYLYIYILSRSLLHHSL